MSSLTLPPDWRNLIAYSDWLLLTGVVIGCLLINLVMLIDTYRSMIVRFTSPTTRGFLSPLLSLSSLFAAKENLWDQGSCCCTQRNFHKNHPIANKVSVINVFYCVQTVSYSQIGVGRYAEWLLKYMWGTCEFLVTSLFSRSAERSKSLIESQASALCIFIWKGD